MNKEEKWKAKRLGMITASELGDITSASGRIIDTNLSYIRSKRWERRHGFSHPVSSRPMEIGNEQEPYIYEWLCHNIPGYEWVYSKNLPEIPFWEAADCPLGASPDCYSEDESIVVEFKTLVSATKIEFFGDEYTSYEEKKADVWKEHGNQLLGQFICNPKVKEIWVIKYIYCDDDILQDTDSPLAEWRGLVFKFSREDYVDSIKQIKERVVLVDAMIDAPVNASSFKSGEWYVNEEGKLIQK